MSATLPITPIPERPRPWIVRHWVLALVSVIVFLVLVCAAGCFAVYSMIEGGMKNSGAYQQAMVEVRRSPEVVDALGEPIKEGFFVGGTIETSGNSGHAELNIPITGPRGKGTVNVSARKFGGRWELQRLEVQVAGQPAPIPLLRNFQSDQTPNQN